MSSKLNPEETRLLKQPYDAFINLQQCEEPTQDREIRAWNGDIVSESDSDNPDEYASAADDSIKRKLVQKKVMQIRRRAKRKRAKELARKRFLSKKKYVRKSVIDKFPDIGKVIEKFVEDRSVGANAWRRTGVLTFDGNRPIEQKVTYEKIQMHARGL